MNMSNLQKHLTKTIMLMGFAGLILSAPRIFADNWTKVEGELELAEQLAKKTVEVLIPKLRKEKSSVVFINFQTCYQPNSWCDVFKSNLESAFISKGIKFLPEDKSSDIRTKIASENLYQHASLQVDVKKAVELGKQAAVHAFITLGIANDEVSIRATASSVSIKEGVVTISENIQMKVNRTTKRSIGAWLLGGTITAGGLYGAYYGHSNAAKQKKLADECYKKYQDAKTAEDATRERKDAEARDKEVIRFDNIAYLSWGVVLVGGWYLWTSGEEESSFKFAATSNDLKENLIQSSLTFQPVFFNRSVGLGVTYEY